MKNDNNKRWDIDMGDREPNPRYLTLLCETLADKGWGSQSFQKGTWALAISRRAERGLYGTRLRHPTVLGCFALACFWFLNREGWFRKYEGLEFKVLPPEGRRSGTELVIGFRAPDGCMIAFLRTRRGVTARRYVRVGSCAVEQIDEPLFHF